jgi:Ca2+-binding EF-hand superfamily protein
MKTLLTATAIGAMLAAGVAIAMQGETPAAPKTPITKAEMLARADARFDRMDTNKDGQLDANERKAGAEAARTAMAERKGGEMADFMPGGGRGGRMGERMLGRIDTNGDGMISKAENRAAAEARFARMDANGDGTIGADERGKGMGKWKRGGGRGGEEGARRDGPRPMDGGMKADANGDGVITRAEFDAQNAARFAAMDANKDGKLDKSELPQRGPRGTMPRTPDTPQGE